MGDQLSASVDASGRLSSREHPQHRNYEGIDTREAKLEGMEEENRVLRRQLEKREGAITVLLGQSREGVREECRGTKTSGDDLLSEFAECSKGRPVEKLLVAAAETTSNLKFRGKADHPRIAKLLGQIKGVEQKLKETRRKLEERVGVEEKGRLMAELE